MVNIHESLADLAQTICSRINFEVCHRNPKNPSKNRNFGHFRMVITWSVLIVEKFCAQFWTPHDALYHLALRNKRFLYFKGVECVKARGTLILASIPLIY